MPSSIGQRHTETRWITDDAQLCRSFAADVGDFASGKVRTVRLCIQALIPTPDVFRFNPHVAIGQCTKKQEGNTAPLKKSC